MPTSGGPVVDGTMATLGHAIRYNRGTGGGEKRGRMSRDAGHSTAAPTPDGEQSRAPSERLLLVGVSGAILWVVAWLKVQLPGPLSRMLPSLPWLR